MENRGCGIDVSQRIWGRRVTEDVGQTCHRGCGTDVSSTEDVKQTCREQDVNRRVQYRGCGIDVSRKGREQTCHRGCGTDVSSTEDVE